MEWDLSGRLFLKESMNILAAIRREVKKVKKQLSKLQRDLTGLQSAVKALGKFKSYQEALGKGQSTSKEGCCLNALQERTSL